MYNITTEPLKHLVKTATNVHKPDGSPNVFVFAMPRGGSTWLEELILSQPGFKAIDEPLNITKKSVRKHLGLHTWESFYTEEGAAALEDYFGRLCDGKLHAKDTNFLANKHYRYLTRRIVFKIIHGGEDQINWFRDTFNGRIVLLLRHPIAVSVSRKSRKQNWRLETLMTSNYREHFTDQQLTCAEKINRSGSVLERNMLYWCLKMAVPLQQRTDDWVVASYEQLVLEPEPVLKELARKLELPALHLMEKQLYVASNSTHKSDEKTQQLLTQDRERLVEKWRSKVTLEEEQRTMEMLGVFEIDAYSSGDVLPYRKYWVY